MSEENKVNESIEEKIVPLRTDKISFEDFIKGYIKCTSVTLKDRYIKEKLKIITTFRMISNVLWL